LTELEFGFELFYHVYRATLRTCVDADNYSGRSARIHVLIFAGVPFQSQSRHNASFLGVLVP